MVPRPVLVAMESGQRQSQDGEAREREWQQQGTQSLDLFRDSSSQGCPFEQELSINTRTQDLHTISQVATWPKTPEQEEGCIQESTREPTEALSIQGVKYVRSASVFL